MKTLLQPKVIAKEKWVEARRLALAHRGWNTAYLALPEDADPEVRRILDFARHGGARQ